MHTFATAALVVVLFAEPSPIVVRGKWVLDQNGRSIPAGSFRRGLQASGLSWHAGKLWSAGDQRSEYPGHLFQIDPKTGRLVGNPIRLELPPRTDAESPHFEVYRRIPNSDFEGLTPHPRDSGVLLAVTEDKVPWIAAIHLEAASAKIASLTEIRFPEDLTSWRNDSNFRMEGLAASDDGRTVYLAFERADDDLPRLYRTSLDAALAGTTCDIRRVAVDFGVVPRRTGKEGARLNLNDIQFLRRDGAPFLLGVARDQERLLVVDLKAQRVSRWVDLDLLDPEGNAVYWVSPEGLAADTATDRLWIVNDPDSVRGNFRRRDEEVASGRFAEYAPLLFELKLSDVFEKAAGS